MLPDGLHSWPVEVLEWAMYAVFMFIVGAHHVITGIDTALGWLANNVVMKVQMWLKRPR